MIMLLKTFRILIYTALVSFVLMSCDIMEEIIPDAKDAGVISANLNGEPFQVEGGKGLLASEFLKAELASTETNFLLTIYGIRIEDNKQAVAMGIQLAGVDISDIQPGDEFTDWVLVDDVASIFKGAKGAVEKRTSVNSDENVFKASSYNTNEMFLTISQIDLEEHKISGTFKFSALDTENDTLINVTEGNFEQVKWKEL
ncbi:hypothetical protein [Algoriphagus aquimarinus]|uniref:hypothetical protein n=1 Tax=Algoriphagus aquimarinus TaxID=237018 RepID=UPI0030D911B1|tara:strand:- start:3308 stop:3907 length:600 start_codon:yes stop_codon:yes gene_type:complete